MAAASDISRFTYSDYTVIFLGVDPALERMARVYISRQQGTKLRELATDLGVSTTRVRQLRDEAEVWIRRGRLGIALTADKERLAELERVIQERVRASELAGRHPVDDLLDAGLSPRTAYALCRGGLTSVEQVRTASSSDLLALRNFGLKGLSEVWDKIG